MAYTQTQTIADTSRRHVLKRVNYANTETDALVVNASALSFAIVRITTDSSANNFKVGETVTSSSGGSATVQDVVSDTLIQVTGITGTFADNDTLTGATTAKTRTQDGAKANATYVLEVANILYDVGGLTQGNKIELMFEGNGGGANNRTIAVLSGSGALPLAEVNARANNNANNATGNITLSCLHWTANSHYTLILDINKQGGYDRPNEERNRSVYSS